MFLSILVVNYKIHLCGYVIWHFLKEIYCTDSVHSVYKDKLQNCSLNQFE